MSTVYSQNCTQILRLARSQYEQGRLHELENLMKGCLAGTGNSGFTKEEKKEAYRLLTLSYIYLEEPEKADETMLALLNIDHFFQVNESLDPAEFIALYNKFRTKPLFWGGLKFGVNVTQPMILNSYFIGSQASGNGAYGLRPGIQFSLSFEKDILSSKFKTGGKDKTALLSFAPEIAYVSRTLSYKNPTIARADEDNHPLGRQEFIINQAWLDFNAMVYYKLKNTQQFKSYLGLGPGVSYLLSSSNQALTQLGNDFTVTGGAVDDSKSYKQLTYSVTALAGVKYKFGDIYVTGDIRYQFGLVNVINTGTRTNAEVGFDYQGQYNDYRVSNFSINLGVAYPYFKPKKLIK